MQNPMNKFFLRTFSFGLCDLRPRDLRLPFFHVLVLYFSLSTSVPPISNATDTGQVTRPNVLFIAVDDLRPELGCYGSNIAKSPNIDRFAESAVTFTRAYCQQAVCNPSRASLMTGLRPDTIKVWDLQTDFRKTTPDAVTLPQQFMKHGYHAVGIGKIFHNNIQDPLSWSEPKAEHCRLSL